jgi:hypothetical protein
VLGKYPPHSEASQWLATVIQEDASRLLRSDLALAQMSPEHFCRLGPKRAAALLPTLATQSDARRRIQGQVARLQSDSLTYPSAGVEQEAQQDVIAAPVRG